ncbi:type II toxin-antitoxin system CcdA family antitoxin [Aminobacter anthyllidis]|uniref:type II toxin-antitoxin system CcdA family antitoxin n=1 Tax=Aminobacter anthyllidis TaxID=1035067 RepID=UPI00313E8C96
MRKPTNVSLDSRLVEEAKALGINMSQAAEAGLAKAISEEKSRQWLEENREAIESSNEYVERHGLPLAKYRLF